MLKSNDYKLFRVDADGNPGLREQFDIGSYPTIKWFKKGKFMGDYDNARDAETIQSIFYFKAQS